MRTTITLDPDVVDLIERTTGKSGVTFKEAVNSAIRRGLAPEPEVTSYVVPVVDLGRPAVDLTKALALAAELEDDGIVRKMSVGR